MLLVQGKERTGGALVRMGSGLGESGMGWWVEGSCRWRAHGEVGGGGGSGTMGWWDCGMVELRDSGIVGWWDGGIVGQWDDRVVGW